ncbi:hypothetical protein AC249_AIPGENE19873 [Exaiptasia diaphana]|nr:hypothetical protein AC249_AIPGENE19873 [Exaiptasia diaphana]
MLTDAFRDAEVGIGIKYRTDGSIFNLRRLQVKTKVSTDTINDFLFADECALNAAAEASMQHIVDKLSDACNNFGLTISTTKKSEKLNAVDKFTCVAHSPGTSSFMMESAPDSRKQVPLLADCTRRSGTGEGSQLRQRSRDPYPYDTPGHQESWPEYDPKSRKYLLIEPNLKVKSNLRPRQVAFWNDFIPFLNKTAYESCVTNFTRSHISDSDCGFGAELERGSDGEMVGEDVEEDSG